MKPKESAQYQEGSRGRHEVERKFGEARKMGNKHKLNVEKQHQALAREKATYEAYG
jgi:hypothetical protein